MCRIYKAATEDFTNKHKTMIYVVSGMYPAWTFAAQAFPYQTDNNPVLCRMDGWWLTEVQNRAEPNIPAWKRNASSMNTTEVLWTRIPADAWAGGWECTPDPSLIHTISMPLILIWTKYNFRPMAGRQVRLLLKNITQWHQPKLPWIPFTIVTVITATNIESPPNDTAKQMTGKHNHLTISKFSFIKGSKEPNVVHVCLQSGGAYRFSELDNVWWSYSDMPNVDSFTALDEALTEIRHRLALSCLTKGTKSWRVCRPLQQWMCLNHLNTAIQVEQLQTQWVKWK